LYIQSELAEERFDWGLVIAAPRRTVISALRPSVRGVWIVNKMVVVVSYDLVLDLVDRTILDPDQGDKVGITAFCFI
jgi:hypothetical protein